MSLTEQSGIFGEPSVPETQVTRAMVARPHGDYTDHDIAKGIVPAYYQYCSCVLLNPVLVIAQMLWETNNLRSWWAARPRRNPAGIGVTGRWQSHPPADRDAWAWNAEANRWLHGISFATWDEDAIPAHIGRLLAWFLAPHERTPLQKHFVTFALTYRPLDEIHHGSARTLRHLGAAHNPSGAGWATPGSTYGRHVAATARRLIQTV